MIKWCDWDRIVGDIVKMPSPGKRKLSPVNASKGGSSTGNVSVPIGGQKKEEERGGVLSGGKGSDGDVRRAEAEEKRDKVQEDGIEKRNNDDGEDAGTGRGRGSGIACQLDKFIDGVGDNDEEEEKKAPTAQRKSSRSTTFRGEMKDPSNSIADRLRSTTFASGDIRKKRRVSRQCASLESWEDNDEDADVVAFNAPLARRKTVRKPPAKWHSNSSEENDEDDMNEDEDEDGEEEEDEDADEDEGEEEEYKYEDEDEDDDYNPVAGIDDNDNDTDDILDGSYNVAVSYTHLTLPTKA